MMTAAATMAAAVAMTEMLTTIAAAVTEMLTTIAAGMTEMFAAMAAGMTTTEVFTMMTADLTDEKPAGKAVVRIIASVVWIVASLVRIGIGIIFPVVRIVGVVTVISAPARKQHSHQQSCPKTSPDNFSPPARSRSTGRNLLLILTPEQAQKLHTFMSLSGSFSAPPPCQEDEKTRLDVSLPDRK
jgi:hypothetical protein